MQMATIGTALADMKIYIFSEHCRLVLKGVISD